PAAGVPTCRGDRLPLVRDQGVLRPLVHQRPPGHVRQARSLNHLSLTVSYPPERVREASARSRKLPSVTTRSPGLTPRSTSTSSPMVDPSSITRSVKRPSPSAAGTYTTARSPSVCTALFGTTIRRSLDVA